MNQQFLNKIIHADCMAILPQLEDKSVNLFLVDPPWNFTGCSWECDIDIDLLFKEYKRALADNGTIVMFGNNPFCAKVITSNMDIYKYSCIWVKPNSTSPHLAKKQPMRRFEEIMVFYNKKNLYNPVMSEGKPYKWRGKRSGGEASNISYKKDTEIVNTGLRFPTNVFEFNQERGIHSTQKPVKLLEHIIKLYTDEGMLVVDSYSGSASTGKAAKNTNRNFICIEKDEEIYKKSIESFRG